MENHVWSETGLSLRLADIPPYPAPITIPLPLLLLVFWEMGINTSEVSSILFFVKNFSTRGFLHFFAYHVMLWIVLLQVVSVAELKL